MVSKLDPTLVGRSLVTNNLWEIESNMDLFSKFYGETFPVDKRPRWIILQNNRYKILWDFFIMLLLLFISIVVPTRLAFTDEETFSWMIVYAFIDLMFLLDILIIFFTSYTSKQREVVTHKQIAVNYLKSWFAFDIFSIIPLDYIVVNDEEVKLNSLIRVAKIARLYKIFRLFRMIKLVKILK